MLKKNRILLENRKNEQKYFSLHYPSNILINSML